MKCAYSNLRDCFTTFAMTGFVLCYVAEIYEFHEKQGGGVENSTPPPALFIRL